MNNSISFSRSSSRGIKASWHRDRQRGLLLLCKSKKKPACLPAGKQEMPSLKYFNYLSPYISEFDAK